MANRLPLTDEEGEVRELNEDDFAHFRPATEILPPSLLQKLGMASQSPPATESVTLRLSREVVERFRATGNGWQMRVDDALKEWLRSHSP
ncbi:MAG: hypothetical protein DM484_21915 [Candidatus Methylumidiphilus alinenensis]|uniref:BrnA antitoxin family protein n=1 Tax=Candidatus Methylumidiphilus alinenensis TaxID=2202197 RepID=A0A2W4SRH6_9GAMM|nr:MAG: hypothetical protein DM484_21915 [Candidatus Methylumidiphilus alinenensis]